MILPGCSDDYFDDFLENDVTHFESSNSEGETNIMFTYGVSGDNIDPEDYSRFRYHGDDPIGAYFYIFYLEKNDIRERLNGGDVIVDEQFFALYNEKGKLVRKIGSHDFDRMFLLVSHIGHPDATTVEYGCSWESGKGKGALPPGKYVSQFTIRYNTTPGTGTKNMKAITFRKSFEVVSAK